MRVELGNGCWQEINEIDRIVTTRFNNGLALQARAYRTGDPEFEEAAARARALGYQTSRVPAGRSYAEEIVWQMTIDHDRIHMELAQAQGMEFSPVLGGVVNRAPVDDDVAHREECAVFYIQKKINDARWTGVNSGTI